ncbi:MAG TPA: nuclease-related domain-containing protein [Clostridiaceae bacterium]
MKRKLITFLELTLCLIGLYITIQYRNELVLFCTGLFLTFLGIYYMYRSSKIKNIIKANLSLFFLFTKGLGGEKATFNSNNKLLEYSKWLDTSKFTIYNNFYLKYNNKDYLMDTLIIGQTIIFNILTKDYSENIVIDEEGNWISYYNDNKSGIENPISHVKINHKIIGDITETKIPIIDVLVITNDKCIIEGKKNSSINIIKVDSILEYIENYSYNSGLLYTNDEIPSFIQLLENKIITIPDKNTESKLLGKLNKLKGLPTLVFVMVIITFFTSFFIWNVSKAKPITNIAEKYDGTSAAYKDSSIILLSNCDEKILKDKVTITINSINKTSVSVTLKVTLQNNYDKDIQLFGSDKIMLTDDLDTTYKLQPMDSKNVYNSISPGSSETVEMVFPPILKKYKSLTLSGELWTIDLGVLDTTFKIPITY